MTLISTLPYPRLLRSLAALVAAGSLACTVDKDLATASDSEPSTSGGETSPGTTNEGQTTGEDPTTTNPDNSSTGGHDPSETTGEPALGCPEHPAIDDCCCFIEGETGGSIQTVCPAGPLLCDPVDLACPEEGDCQDVNDEAFVDCALSALKGQTAGEIRVHNLIDDDTQRSFTYHIVGDGSAYRVDLNKFDFMFTIDTERFTLQPPEFFDTCLAGTLAEKSDCLANAVAGASEEICVPQIMGDDV